MIYKKQYGHPFDTESVVGSFVPAMETIPYLTREPDGFSYAMDPQDILYGLGENIRGINKRGWVYESKCSDDPNHTETKSSLYGAYNFMIVSGKATFGFFIDYPGKVTFDCGYTDLDTLRVTVAEENYDLYIIEGEPVPPAGRAQLHPAQMGLWCHPEPLELHERGRGARGCGQLPHQQHAAGRRGAGY